VPVTSIRQRIVDEAAQAIEDDFLRLGGQSVRDADAHGRATDDEWRRAARAVARKLGQRIVTRKLPNGRVIAVLDGPLP
jgi:hypothetical protein